MQFKKLEQSALTPELGGKFTDLKLRVKPWFFGQRRTEFVEGKDNIDKDGKISNSFIRKFDKKVLSLVIGWENLFDHETGKPVECNESTKEQVLHNNATEKVNHYTANVYAENKEINANEKMELFTYIQEFAGIMENFEKNSLSTALSGGSGGSHGSGKPKTMPES